MTTVTQRIGEIKQPYGGYLRVRDFEQTVLQDGVELFSEENIHASLIGLAVDYLTRFMMGDSKAEAFEISLRGARCIGELMHALELLECIKGLDDRSVYHACQLVGYDVCFRAGSVGYKPVQDIRPDQNTIWNIRTMVNRSINFWKDYGPIVKAGFTMEGGYTATVNTGDGDYLTEDTLWDFKVSKRAPNSKQTLQLLMYYIMGMHSVHRSFDTIRNLGIYNPRLNIVYTYPIDRIDRATILEVEQNVIGYDQKEPMDPAAAASGVYADVPNEAVFTAGRTLQPEVKTENQYRTKENEQQEEIWFIPDLMERYGVKKSYIKKKLIPCGLPYDKRGKVYCFSPDDVVSWEIQQRYIRIGAGKKIVLPGYIEYGKKLRKNLKKAKKEKDRRRIRKIKKKMTAYGYCKTPYWIAGGLLIAGLALIMLGMRIQ